MYVHRVTSFEPKESTVHDRGRGPGAGRQCGKPAGWRNRKHDWAKLH